jgi:hypothetical protein
MPRGPRVDAEGVAHHVWQRGAGRMVVFIDDTDRAQFMARFERLLIEQRIRAFGIVLMSNHYHAALQTGPSALWRFMHRLLTGYALWFNKRHEHAGHVFQNRYGSRALKGDEELATVVVYGARNPLAAGMAKDEPELRRYVWSSYPALMGEKAPRFGVSLGATLSLFGDTERAAREELRRRVVQGVTWEAGAQPVAEQAPLSPERAVRFSAIATEVCACANVDPLETRRRPLHAEARAARQQIAVRARAAGFSAREIARELGVSEWSVRRATSR